MPHKEAIKLKAESNSITPIKKSKYKVKNWTVYNKSLRNRGKLSLYFPKGDLRSQFINDESYSKGAAGRTFVYSSAYIEVIFIHYRLFGWGIRQITGYFEDLWESKNLDIAVPSFGNLSDLFASLSVEVKQFCHKLKKRLEAGEDVSLILDATGLRFGRASHWYEMKYNKACKNRPWNKMHLSMDPDMNIHAVEITNNAVSDITMQEILIPNDIAIDKIIADGGYYSIEGVERLYLSGITPVIPPPRDAVIRGKPDSSWHDKIVSYIETKGTVYAFHKKYGYGVRALIEAQFSRIKRCIGSSLLTENDTSKKAEGSIIGNIINLWNSFGQCESVKIG
jgi:hypothetical protein